MEKQPMEQLLTTQEVANQINRPYRTVYDWFRKGYLPCAAENGGRIYFSKQVVEERTPELLNMKPGRKRKAA
jgi:excisionase family DNA binding protein